MDKMQHFLTVMAALSAASQTLTEHLFKMRWAEQLDTSKPDPVAENRRKTLIHFISGIIGALLAGLTGIRPLTELAQATQSPGTVTPNVLDFSLFGIPIVEYLLIGVLISYGGSFFNELLGVLKEFKDAQTQIKNAAGANAAAAAGSGIDQSITPGVPAKANAGVEEEGFTDANRAG